MFKYTILQNQYFPKAALILALAYFLYVAIPIIQDFGTPKTRVMITTDLEMLDQEKPENKPRDFLLIHDWHLFGQLPSDAIQISDQNGVPQETQLQIKLLGVFFLPDQKIPVMQLLRPMTNHKKNTVRVMTCREVLLCNR